MNLKQVTDKQEWNEFVQQNGPRSGAFLHSWGWGELAKSQGKKVVRLGLKSKSQSPNDKSNLKSKDKKEELEAVAMVITQAIGAGFNYAYCPRGPIIKRGHSEGIKNILREFVPGGELANKLANNYFAFRFDPPVEDSAELGKRLITAPHDVQPRKTILLDLSKTPEELLKEMHKKTRYNIRLSERNEIRVETHGIESFVIFWNMLTGTAGRDKFRTHPKQYYADMLAMKDDQDLSIFLSVAYFEGKPVASAIIADFGDTRTYLHGASDYSSRNLMAPFGLHWHLMNAAKKHGMKWYDFWGIAATDNKNEPLYGVTRFKRGFGGEEVGYSRTLDLVLQPWRYRFYRLIHRIFT